MKADNKETFDRCAMISYSNSNDESEDLGFKKNV